MQYLVILTLLIYFLVLVKIGPLAAVLITVAWIIGCVLLYVRMSYRSKLHHYGHRLENIYEWQQSPDDKKVVLRAQKHQEWLQLSGHKMGVRVITIFYQDAHNPSETWEEYTDRVAATIANDRILRHQEIERSQGRDYYLREMHGQKGIRFPEEPEPVDTWTRLFTRKKQTA
ncbi:hypothetical protein [Lewinella sp. LCG006]|uniref:hypothetical protein n=1 Tax=Lewinella sp. LCG006 TaxID=3231911 RepID=UPI003460FDB7